MAIYSYTSGKMHFYFKRLTINFDAEFNLAWSSSLNDIIFQNTFNKIELKLVTKQEAAYQQSIVKVSEVVHKFSEAISQDSSKF